MESGIFENMYYERFVAQKTAHEAVIFIHGYPGNREDKNRDLINTDSLFDSYLVHHAGLGKSQGSFGFRKCALEFKRFYQFVQGQGYQKVHLVGHSWGGFLALSVQGLLQSQSKMLLLSPFLEIPEGEKLNHLVNVLYHETLPFIGHMSKEELFLDLSNLSRVHNFDSFQKNLMSKQTSKIKIIQAAHDVETPAEIARKLVHGLDQIAYAELETDHSFESVRVALKKLISEFIDGK